MKGDYEHMKRNKKKQLKSMIGTLTIAVSLLINGMGVSVSAAGTSEAEQKPKAPVVSSDGVATWDCIYFGNFWQRDTNGDGIADQKDEKEPIKWRVLSVDGNDAFLITDSILYQMVSCSKDENNRNWENSNIRSWLNSYGMDDFPDESLAHEEGLYNSGFLNVSFTSDEKNAIIKQTIDGCSDYIYLPSKEEMLSEEYGFSSDEDVADAAKVARVTAYSGTIQAGTQSAWGYGLAHCYWLRNFSQDPVYVNEGMHMDEIHRDGTYSPTSFWMNGFGLRAVLHIDLSKDVWEYAGIISSDTALEKQSGEYHYFVFDDEAVITAYDGKNKIVTIPDELDSYPVGYVQGLEPYWDETLQDDDAYQDWLDAPRIIEEITFPDSVWKIEQLGQSNLSKVQLGECLRVIGPLAFSGCEQLTSIEIPDSVIRIDYDAFSGCINLGVLKLSANIQEIASYVFDYETIENGSFYLVVEKGSYAEQYAIKEELPYAYSEGGNIYNKPDDDDDDDDDAGNPSSGTGQPTPPAAKEPVPSQMIPENQGNAAENKQLSKGASIR